MQEVAKRKQALAEAQKAVRMANERVAKHDDSISAALKSLSTRRVTIDSLVRTQVGKTVNKLRTCDVKPIAEASQKLVLSWKTLAERGDRTGAKVAASR